MASDPAPASGSAAAFALAMSAALAQKVADRSRGFDGAAGLSRRAEGLRLRSLELVDADHRAVQEMLTRGAPGQAAVAVPEQIGEVAAELLEIAGELEESGSPWLIADSVGARELARAAASMAEAILRSNAG